MADFNKAFKILIGNEGGFQESAADKGNWTGGKVGVGQLLGTKFGISAAFAATHNLDLNISNYTLPTAQQIYYRWFWGPIQGDSLPWHVAINVFDMAVQSGVRPAVKTAQAVLGALLGNGNGIPSVKVDGAMGPMTIAAADASDEVHFSNAFFDARLKFLQSLSIWSWLSKGLTNRLRLVNSYATNEPAV